MISPKRAHQLVLDHCSEPTGTTLPIEDTLGYVLAEDVRAPSPMPHFDNSAMDGFALRSSDAVAASTTQPTRLTIADTVYAGAVMARGLRKGECCRIMTGGAVPRGADSVIPKEDVSVDGLTLVVERPVVKGRHVRRRGEEVKKGALVLRRGVVVHPGTITCLAAFGKRRVRVVRRPRVAVVTTGDEALPPGSRLKPGQIYDSNSFMLAAMLRQMGITPVRERHVKDHPTALANAVKAALRQSDVLIMVGGVSVGDRDYIRSVLQRNNVREVFWRVSQKPGKPLFFGTKGKRLVFGLPGNPASAFACFYLYVYPALRCIAGFRRPSLQESMSKVANGVRSDGKRWMFVRGKSAEADVVRLGKQGSHMITSLAEMDRFIVVPPAAGEIGSDENVLTYRLPREEESS